MSKKVTLGSSEYTLNQQGDGKGWGETQQDLLEAVVDSINGFFGPGDILPTTQLITNAVGVLGIVDGSSGIETTSGVVGVALTELIGSDGDSYRVTVAGINDYASTIGNIITTQVGQFLNKVSGVWVKSSTPPIANYIVLPFFQFDGSVVRFFEAEYTVIRKLTTNPELTIFESGKIFGENSPSTGSDVWELTQHRTSEEEADIYFDINSSGQIIYATSNMVISGKTYNTAESKITFKVKSIIK